MCIRDRYFIKAPHKATRNDREVMPYIGYKNISNMYRSSVMASLTWIGGLVQLGIRPAFLNISNHMRTGEKLMKKLRINWKIFLPFKTDKTTRLHNWTMITNAPKTWFFILKTKLREGIWELNIAMLLWYVYLYEKGGPESWLFSRKHDLVQWIHVPQFLEPPWNWSPIELCNPVHMRLFYFCFRIWRVEIFVYGIQLCNNNQ